MGKLSRSKGYRRERQVVQRLRELGLAAERVPLSGATGGDFSGDIIFRWSTGDYRAEVKARRGGAGWKTVKEWLGAHDALFLIEDREDPLVVIPWSTFKKLIGEPHAPEGLETAG